MNFTRILIKKSVVLAAALALSISAGQVLETMSANQLAGGGDGGFGEVGHSHDDTLQDAMIPLSELLAGSVKPGSISRPVMDGALSEGTVNRSGDGNSIIKRTHDTLPDQMAGVGGTDIGKLVTDDTLRNELLPSLAASEDNTYALGAA